MKAKVIVARNVNEALVEGLWHLRVSGKPAESRNGPVIRAPGPVITEYTHPTERVLFSETRDANPVFHLMEAIWMLAGENDVGWISAFNTRMTEYANGTIIHGAYGHRWRNFFDFDQILLTTDLLRASPETRRAVIAMWDPCSDLDTDWKDIPCNTHIYFEIVDKALAMTVCCRSNDIIWGAYGANAVHFSILQELIALELGLSVGPYYQVSNNFHLYTEMGPGHKLYVNPPMYSRLYPEVIPLLVGEETLVGFIADCEAFLRNKDTFKCRFMRDVAYPLKTAYLERKLGNPAWPALLRDMPDCDWKLAFLAWVERRSDVSQ